VLEPWGHVAPPELPYVGRWALEPWEHIEEVAVEVPPSNKEEIPKGSENKNNNRGEGSSRTMDSKLEDVQKEFQVLKL
jgi:hypothetical protein